jgi:hypothetical protein
MRDAERRRRHRGAVAYQRWIVPSGDANCAAGATSNMMSASHSTGPKPRTAATRAVQIARENEDAALRGLAIFGHLTSDALARMRYPNSSPESGYEMARRTLCRLAARGLVIPRRNGGGGKSFILTAKGAQLVEAIWGLSVRDGYDLQSVAGPTWRHRALATNFLATRIASGETAWGEHALVKGWGPATLDVLRATYGKVPDGLVLRRSGDLTLVDWVEVESTYKPKEELRHLLELAWITNTWLGNAANKILLDRLTLVFDASEHHEERIRRAALAVARAKMPPHTSTVDLLARFQEVFASVDLFRAQVTPPMRVRGFESVTLLESLRQSDPRLAPSS